MLAVARPVCASTDCGLRAQLLAMVDQAFMAGAQRHTVKLVMKRLKATQGRLREEAKASKQRKVRAVAVRVHLAAARLPTTTMTDCSCAPAAKASARKTCSTRRWLTPITTCMVLSSLHLASHHWHVWARAAVEAGC